MRQDEVSFIARRDEVILKYGNSLFERNESQRASHITQRMRILARLVQHLRIVTQQHSHDLVHFLTPPKFDYVVDATKTLYNFKWDRENEEIGAFASPSFALKIGHALKGCANILRGIALRKKSKEMKADVNAFTELIDSEWAVKISASALRTLNEAMFNKTPVLPVTDNLVKIRNYLVNEMPLKIQDQAKNPQLATWRCLAELCITRILLSNKWRGSEGSKIEISQYVNSSAKGIHPDTTLNNVSHQIFCIAFAAYYHFSMDIPLQTTF